MTENIDYHNSLEENVDKRKIKLHYDYETYENILNNSKKEDIIPSREEEINNDIIIPTNKKNILNSNFKNYKIQDSKSNESKGNGSFNYIPDYSQFTQQTTDILNKTENKNMILFNKLRKELKLNYNEEIKSNELKLNKIDDNKKINNGRNNSINYSKLKVIPKTNKVYLLEDNNENIIYKNNLYDDKNLQDFENEKIDKKEYKTEYNNINKNKFNKDNKYFYNTYNKLSEYLITANEDMKNDNNNINEINDIISEESKPIKTNIKNLGNKRMQNHKSSPHLNSNLYSELYNYSKADKLNFEKIKNKLILENNKIEKEKNEIINKYKILISKSESIAKDNFIIKTKYEVNKNNMKLLQKKLEEKNYDIEQMKKVLLSNHQQINFLTTLKDSNIKTAKDNEELIQNLKETISNLNKIILENNNKIAFLKKQNQNDKIQKIKKENEFLKLYLKDREKTISTLKNIISIYTQNLDNILNNNQNIADINIETSEDNEVLINECEIKIKEFKEKIENMQKKMNEILHENIIKEKEKNDLKMKIEKNLENLKKIQNEYGIMKKKNEEMNVQIEEYKNKIIEKEKEIEIKDRESKELKNDIENKNKEILEIKNEIEKYKKEIENNIKENEELKNEIKAKNKEISEKNYEIEDKNNIINQKENEIKEKIIEIENKNNEINEKQNLLDKKNKELEEKSKEIDLQIIQKANLDFFEKVKQFEIDIKNKDKQIEDLKNNNKNEIKENKEINFENKIVYTQIQQKDENKRIIKNDLEENKENKNINTEYNNINYLTKKILFDNKKEDNNEIEKVINYDFKEKNDTESNFDYNNYKNKEDFSGKIKRKESNKNENNKNKKKINIKKELNRNNKSNNSNNEQNEKFIIPFRDNISKINNDNKERENSQIYKNKKISQGQYSLNYNYLKTENNKNINIKKIENIKNNKIPEKNINKESKVKTNSININNIDKIKYNNFENKNIISNNIIKLDFKNNNEEDINTRQYNQQFNDNEDINKNNNYINYDKDTNNKNIEITSTNLQASSSMTFSQNEDIKLINYKENKKNQFNYIYSLIGQDLLSFDLKEKKFEIITIRDNTNGIFNSYIEYYQENKLNPLILNSIEGFYILLHKYIFYYDQINNNISILVKLISHHTSGGFIYIKNELYSLSGNNTTQCEKYSLLSNKNIILPNTNFPRVNSGICNINNEYIYLFFGKANINSIERLYIGNNINYNYNDNWEIVRINQKIGFIDGNICLDKFASFLDDYSNIIIFGGEDCKGNENKNIYGFNLNNNNISIIGKIDSCSLYCTQYIMLDESIFSIYDINNGLHFFNKELDYHEIFNLNI